MKIEFVRPRLDELTLSQINLGIFLGIIALGIRGMILSGPYTIIGSVAWAPHAYNWVLWGAFGVIFAWNRWKIRAFIALFMAYSIDELIWSTTYVITTCSKNWTQFGIQGSAGYYVMIWIIAVVTLFIIKPKIKIRPLVWIPFVVWFLAYVFYFHMPIMGNMCLVAPNLANLGWEVVWQLGYFPLAYFTFYPKNLAQST